LLEYRKIKRTGFLPAFFGGGILAAAVPIVNMAVRSEMYLGLQGTAIQILMDANWQMMAMLNVLLVVSGACLLYHVEHADGGLQKMRSLPIREGSVFFGKVAVMMLMCVLVLAMEAASVLFCSWHWFQGQTDGGQWRGGQWGGGGGNVFAIELCKSFGYAFLLILPCVILSLLMAEACKNMWVSLGIGVVCVFTATMLPTNSFVLSLFPFAMPFQVFAGMEAEWVTRFVCAAAVEIVMLGGVEVLMVRGNSA
jgi:hypothetical protein